MHNLATVISFEFLRTITKPKFWLLSLAVPIMIGLVVALITFSNSTAQETTTSSTAGFSYLDNSGLINPAVADAMGGTLVTDAAAARQQVIDGRLDAFLEFPVDPVTEPVLIAAQDQGLFDSGRYSAVATTLMEQSVALRIGDRQLATLAVQPISTDTTSYTDGQVSKGPLSLLLPGMFLILFYMAVVMLGNQMLNVTLEEKENRVTEMILTMMNPTTLIVGKVIALVLIGLLQALVVAVPGVAALFILPRTFNMPQFDLSSIPIEFGPLAMGFAIVVSGFLLFAGMLVAIGAVMPSAKEAGSAFGVVVVLLFLPLYAFALIVSDPNGLVSTVFTYFPLTAPVTALVRNATGNLAWWEGMLVVGIIATFAAVFLSLGVKLFRTGAISYNSKVSIRRALGR